MNKVLFLVVVVAIGCGGDSTGTDGVNLSGSWTFSGNFSNAQISVSCDGSGTANITHTGSTFSGNVVQQGSCNGPGGVVDNSGTLQVVGGQVDGNSVSFQLGSCSYTGTISGSNRMTGSTTCQLAFLGQNYTFTGQWQAGR